MCIERFDYDLPPERIAQIPCIDRDGSRLLVLGETNNSLTHRRFSELPQLLRAGDLVVLNDARVLPARLSARRLTGGRVEVLLIAPVPRQGMGDPSAVESRWAPRWRALLRPARRLHPGSILQLVEPGDPKAPAGVEIRVLELLEDGSRVVEFPYRHDVEATMQAFGLMPLPPYIHRVSGDGHDALDRERYQTVYAEEPGAVAAPTAGLHFTKALLDRLEKNGVGHVTLTLDVGPGTFRPVTASRVDRHRMDEERYFIPELTAKRIRAARLTDGRVIAVGTTVVRALEHASATCPDRCPNPGAGIADLFITPGYSFRAVDGMITNFHLPRSTPILLVSALVGRERLLEAYREAVERGYRFYSYGDAMLTLPT